MRLFNFHAQFQQHLKKKMSLWIKFGFSGTFAVLLFRRADQSRLFVYYLHSFGENLLWDVWSSLVNLKVISSLMLLYSSYLIFFMERTEWPYFLLFLIKLLVVENFNEVKKKFCLTEKQKHGNVSKLGRTFASKILTEKKLFYWLISCHSMVIFWQCLAYNAGKYNYGFHLIQV